MTTLPDQYLVLIRGAMDDFPFLLTDDYNVAYDTARTCDPMDASTAGLVMGVDIANIVSVAIVSFSAGRVVKFDLVKTFEKWEPKGSK